ncbi:DNA-binding protein [Paenibacillus larvae]|nr:DNA-binding protein [Paenibacillus larvae]MDT2260581.1 DNA-binding protein [Paenibacillus larvae]
MENKKIDELPDILTALLIANYLGISRRRVYELFKLNPEYGGILIFKLGKQNLLTRMILLSGLKTRLKKNL